MDDMMIEIVRVGLGRARAETQTGRGQRRRHSGQPRKFLDMCEFGSHGHSFVKPRL